MEESESGLRWTLALVLAAIVVGGTTDLVLDRPTDWLSFHVLFETLLIVAALVMAAVLWRGWWRAQRSAEELRRELAAGRADRDAWRESARRALEGLSEAIDRQFAEWGLTEAEREVALLMLKGYSHKAIARLTGRSDATVRQHASAVYQKAGLSGRAQLAAFFLEDLMLPRGDGGRGEDGAQG